MPLYLTRFSCTPASWATLVKNPERGGIGGGGVGSRYGALHRVPGNLGRVVSGLRLTFQ